MHFVSQEASLSRVDRKLPTIDKMTPPRRQKRVAGARTQSVPTTNSLCPYIHRNNLENRRNATQVLSFCNALIGVQVAQPQMARAADTVVAAGQYGPLMRQRVVVADQTYRARIGLGLVLLVRIIIVGGGDLRGGELGRRVGTVRLAPAAVADHRGAAAGTAATSAVPAAVAAAPAASAAASAAAAGHAGTVQVGSRYWLVLLNVS